MAVLKNVENKIKLVMIVSSLFLVGCVIVSLGSIIIAKGMVDEAHKKVYVLDGTVPILVKQTTQEETFDVEAKSDIEMFHQFFFTLVWFKSPFPSTTLTIRNGYSCSNSA